MAGPDPQAKKYDRQIRIWGAHGQAALEAARICLLHAGPAGTETLKNLVLGGIASFTVVDAAKVAAADLGNNFLLDASSLGTGRAQAATELLQELNDAVKGSFVDESPEELVRSNPGFFEGFDLVIATQMREQDVVQLEAVCRGQGRKLVAVRAYGLIGTLRTSCGEQCILESKPESTPLDLRLDAPWPELAAYAEAQRLEEMDDITHRHIPWAVLLVKAIAQWRKQHGGKLPSSKERGAFRQLLQSWQRTIEGVPVEEENFTEAMENTNRCLTPASIPSEVRAVLQDPAASSLTRESADFWVMVAALADFVAQEGGEKLPVQASIPDMWSATALYLDISRLYKAKAVADAAAVQRHVAARLQALSRPPDAIPAETVKLFVRQAGSLRVVRFPLMASTKSPAAAQALRNALGAEDSSLNAGAALLLRAVDRFHQAHSRYPGWHDGQREEDVPQLKQLLGQVLSEMGLANTSIQDDLVAEMCRFGAAEIHCVGAILGGIAAQEIIKLLTRQFVPMSGLLVWNAMHSTSSVLKL